MSNFILYEVGDGIWQARVGDYPDFLSALRALLREYRNHPDYHYKIWDVNLSWWIDENTIDEWVEIERLQDLIPCLNLSDAASVTVNWHEEGF